MQARLAVAVIASLAIAGTLKPPPSARAACPSPSLEFPVTHTTGVGPVEVAAADLDGDGLQDLVTTASGAGAVSILYGVPGGGFESHVEVAVGGQPFDVAVRDLNGDGRPDLVVTNRINNTLQVLLATGPRSYLAPPLAIFAGSSPYELALGDFNADGLTDAAVADNGEANIRVLLGVADGTGHWAGFLPSVPYATSQLSLAILAGDWNGDGITDLAATEYLAGTVAIFLGNGNGTFRGAVHAAAGTEPYDLSSGDYNGDGRLDLAVSNSSNDGIRVLLGSNSGFFPVTNTYLQGLNASGIATADFDGDGRLDLAVSGSVAGSVQLLKGAGDGTFSTNPSLPTCCFPVHVIACDLDQDGRPDAAVCNYQTNTVAVFLDGCPLDPRLPVITDIRDVPNDQGGKVLVTWTASSLDVTGGPVNQYRVWRMVPPGAPAMRSALDDPTRFRREARSDGAGATATVYWEALATLPAQRLEGYGYTAATPQDSLPSGNPFFTYRITAATNDPDAFYDSEPDSGYSVDNLAPAMPAGFVSTPVGGGTNLYWNANAEADLAGYRLYRSSDPGFVPSEATLLATVTGLSFLDTVSDGSTYKLRAMDVHGNEGLAATLTSAVTGVQGAPARTWLGEPSPNPARNGSWIRFGLARGGALSLRLYDSQGRLVRSLVSGVRPAGEFSLRWDQLDQAGHRTRAGRYYVELRTGAERLVRPLVRLD